MASRRCAICLCQHAKISLCRGCHRRAYCSKACQSKDWTPGKGGQGHKLWCTLQCGEEGIDWEVREADGTKGLGVFALKDIPRCTRIMVDGTRKNDDPAFADLLPIGGTRKQKIDRNGFMRFMLDAPDKTTTVVYLRAARLNHSCSNNAFTEPEPTDYNGTTVVSQRDIRAGEEITISYRSSSEPMKFFSCKEVATYLKDEHGISCPSDCICKDSQRYRLCLQAHLVYQQMEASLGGPQGCASEKTINQAFDLHKVLLQLHQAINGSYSSRIKLMRHMIHAVHKHTGCGRNMPLVDTYMEEVLTFSEAIFHPHGRQFQSDLILKKQHDGVNFWLRQCFRRRDVIVEMEAYFAAAALEQDQA